MAKFQKLVNFLVSYNELCKFAEVSWEIIDEKLYIDGIPKQLANLFSLLWSSTENESFYFTRRNNSSMIEVITTEKEEE